MSRRSQSDREDDALGGWQPVGEAVFWGTVFIGLTVVAFSLGEGAAKRNEIAQNQQSEEILPKEEPPKKPDDGTSNELFNKPLDNDPTKEQNIDFTKNASQRVEPPKTDIAKPSAPVPLPVDLPTHRLPLEAMQKVVTLASPPRRLEWESMLKFATLAPMPRRLEWESKMKLATLAPATRHTDMDSMIKHVALVPKSNRLPWKDLTRFAELKPATRRLDVASMFRQAVLEPAYHTLDVQSLTKFVRLISARVPDVDQRTPARIEKPAEKPPVPRVAMERPAAIELKTVPERRKVGEALLVIARVVGSNKQALQDQPVEWTLDRQGVGQIVALPNDDSISQAGEKLLPTFARSFTSRTKHRPNGWQDVEIQPGETWCVVESPSAGAMHLTVRAVNASSAPSSIASAYVHWDHAKAIFTEAIVAQAGTDAMLATRIVSSEPSPGLPLPDYRVRYALEDANGALIQGTGSGEVVSGYDGWARIPVVQPKPKIGVTRGKVELLGRNPLSGFPAPILASGTFTIEWKEPAVKLNVNGPSVASAGEWIPLVVAGTISNPELAENLRLVLVPGRDVEARAGENGSATDLGPWPKSNGASTEVFVRSKSADAKTIRFELRQGSHLWTTVEHSIRFTSAQLALAIDLPKSWQMGKPSDASVTVTNTGLASVDDVQLRQIVPVGFQLIEAIDGQREGSEAFWTIGRLEPGAKKVFRFAVSSRASTSGSFKASVTSKQMKEAIEVTQLAHVAGNPSLTARVRDSYDPIEVGGEIDYEITVENQGSADANNIQVEVLAPAGMELVKTTGNLGGTIVSGKLNIPAIQQLPAGGKATATIRVRAREKGVSRLVVRVKHPSLERGLVEQQESTVVYVP